MRKLFIPIFLVVSLSIMGSPILFAQSLPPPEDPVPNDQDSTDASSFFSPDEFYEDSSIPFTGTLAEDDPQNQEFIPQEGSQDTDIDSETDGEYEEEEEEIIGATHLIKFEFTSRVQFIQMNNKTEQENTSLMGEPYMEIEYLTQWEKQVDLTQNKYQFNIDAEYDIDNWGPLAENEFFSCRLEINVEKIPVSVIVRTKISTDPETEIESTSLFLKIDFDKEVSKEDWLSLCTDISGAILNTQGDKEDYNLKVLNLIQPALTGLVVDDFDSEYGAKIDLVVEPEIFNDYEINNNIIFSGEGSVSIETL